MANNHPSSKLMALGGVLAALAVVVMSMGTIIPVATYVCPVICILILQIVLKSCGKRTAWAWFGAVSLLSLLLAPDKEAAIFFLFLGSYPIVKPKLDRGKGKLLRKLAYFNLQTILAYGLMIYVLGFASLGAELTEFGKYFTALLLILGNLTFLLLDRLLERSFPGRK